MTNRIVARYKDGTVIKGQTGDFTPMKPFFHLEKKGGEVVTVKVEDLKAIRIDMNELKAAFFVKDYMGNRDYNENYADEISGAGKKVKVIFLDGEEITGYVLSYSPDRHGFFITPADRNSNNERIFVINSATKSVKFI